MKLFFSHKSFTEAALNDKGLQAEFVKRHVATENKPIDFEDLDYAFTGYDGKKYYIFRELHMPPIREAKKNEFIIWLTQGLTPDQFNELLDLAEEAIGDGLAKMTNKKPINVIRISAILQEIRLRKDVNNVEVIYNLLAIHTVREDESPSKFDADKHEQKVQQFLEDAEGENRFFFRMIALNKYLGSLNISEENFKNISADYQALVKRHSHVLETLSSSKELDVSGSVT